MTPEDIAIRDAFSHLCQAAGALAKTSKAQTQANTVAAALALAKAHPEQVKPCLTDVALSHSKALLRAAPYESMRLRDKQIEVLLDWADAEDLALILAFGAGFDGEIHRLGKRLMHDPKRQDVVRAHLKAGKSLLMAAGWTNVIDIHIFGVGNTPDDTRFIADILRALVTLHSRDAVECLDDFLIDGHNNLAIALMLAGVVPSKSEEPITDLGKQVYSNHGLLALHEQEGPLEAFLARIPVF